MRKVGSIVVTTEYEEEKRGGLGTYTDMIVRYLKKRFGEICVVEIPMKNEGYFSCKEGEGGEVVAKIPFPSFEKRESDGYEEYVDSFLSKVEVEDGCVTIGNDWFGGYVSSLIKKRSQNNLKSIFVPHTFSSLIRLKGYEGDEFESLVEKADSLVYQRGSHELEKRLVRNSDEVLFISSYMQKFAKRNLGFSGDGPVVNHYVEYTPMTKISYEDELGDIVFAGRFVEQKGVLDLAEHMGDILEVLPESRFHFYGKGGMGPILKWATRRFGERVKVHGFVPREELLCLLPEMDLLVMPSIFEPFGFSALEAMAAGVPIAATDTGGLGDLTSWLPDGLRFQRSFGTNPLYRSPENVGAYISAEELLRVFRFAESNPDVLRRVGKKGGQIAMEEYNRQRFERDMDDFLASINALPAEST